MDSFTAEPVKISASIAQKREAYNWAAAILQSKYKLDAQQAALVKDFVCTLKNTLLLGGPGAGKTHVTKCIMETVRMIYPISTRIVALPYMAKNIASLAGPGVSAMTMSRYLCQKRTGKPNIEAFKRKCSSDEWRGGATNVYPNQSHVVFVIDEFPIMPDTLVKQFLEAVGVLRQTQNVLVAAILFVGDAYQGGPVSGASPLSYVVKGGALAANICVLRSQHRYANCPELGTIMNFLRYKEKPRSPAQWADYNAKAAAASALMERRFVYQPSRYADITLAVSNARKAQKINALFALESGPKMCIIPTRASKQKGTTTTDGAYQQTWIRPGGDVYAVENHELECEEGGTRLVYNGNKYTVVDFPGSSAFATTVDELAERYGAEDAPTHKRRRSQSTRIEAKDLYPDPVTGEIGKHVRIRCDDGTVLLATAIKSNGYLYFPFDDARAMTIKKSQGMTIGPDKTIMIDMTGCPRHARPDNLGLAVSRATSLDNMLVPNCDVDDILTVHREQLIDCKQTNPPLTVEQLALLRQLREEGLTTPPRPAPRNTVAPPPPPPVP